MTSAPRTTIWPLDPHTRAKHEILRRYLDAWIPILSLGKFPKLVYIDGFAGPGQYSKGESGSPILAIKAVLAQRVAITAELEFFFVEKEADRSTVLESLVRELSLPRNLICSVLTSSFVEAYGSTIRPHLDGIPRAPVFAFLDPFGYTGIPFSVVREILQRPSAEVLVTFMYEEINRFATVEGQAVHMDQLFGTTEWRDIARLTRVSERRTFLENLYAQQLRGCTNFVRSFEMRNKKNATDYFLFYATSHHLGLAKMKEAMWRVDSGGDFSFSDATDPNQNVLFGKPDHATLGEVIHAAFQGRIATVKEIERFVVERTAFTASHYKKALKSLETSSPPRVQPSGAPATRKPGTYPDGDLLLRFT